MRTPPRLFLRFFRWFCHPDLRSYIEGDLMELYDERVTKIGKRRADLRFVLDVILLFRPSIIKPISKKHFRTNNRAMIKSYFTIGWRALLRNRGYSVINIGGLAIGMAVAMLIGLWVYDELSFNRYHRNYDNIVQLWHGQTDPNTHEISGGLAMQYAIAEVLKKDYQHHFKHVIKSWWTNEQTLATADNKFRLRGKFMEPAALEVFGFEMLMGNHNSLNDPKGFVISASAAAAIFGDSDPVGKSLRIDDNIDVLVTGVYKDLPANSTFSDVRFIGTFETLGMLQTWVPKNVSNWEDTFLQLYAQLQPGVTVESTNAAIHNVFLEHYPDDLRRHMARYKPYPQVVPMSTWHLYSEFENGKPAAGRITFVWLFGTIGVFVLLLAAINFTNLTTARSEKRAREVGVRKTVGSMRSQLVAQFLSESFVVTILAFVIALMMVVLSMDLFNVVADKGIQLPVANPVFWGIAMAFVILTTLLAGIYPAFFLSSFRPASVLKGASHGGQFGSWPRKVLVVVQFSVSTILIIGTLVVYQQVHHARNRPVGYNRNGLISIQLNDPDYKRKENVLRTELLATGTVTHVSFSSSPVTAIFNSTGGYDWKGRDPNFDAEFAICHVTPDYGKTIGWRLYEGRDFSTDIASDTLDAVIVNRAAMEYMGWDHAAGETLIDINAEDGAIRWSKTIIGVVEDMVMESPYEPVSPTIFFYRPGTAFMMNLRLNPSTGTGEALLAIERTVKSLVPGAIFNYKFIDDEYAVKFSQEERVGTLAGIFATLAILISCMGLFGLASFVAERRSKEIGIRKVMGATVATLWRMLSKDFFVLVMVSCLIAIPPAYWLMSKWLAAFEYRTEISWWIFGITCLSALFVTLLTVSYQAVKAAMMNPVNSLRSE